LDARVAEGVGGVVGAARGTVEVDEAHDEEAAKGQAVRLPTFISWVI
jgi:hypothetical protein